jgi:hypothetical protein
VLAEQGKGLLLVVARTASFSSVSFSDSTLYLRTPPMLICCCLSLRCACKFVASTEDDNLSPRYGQPELQAEQLDDDLKHTKTGHAHFMGHSPSSKQSSQN